MSKKQSWANRSGRSWQKSIRELFALVAHDKRANERIARFFERIAHSLFCSQKTINLLKNIWLKSYFLERFWYIFCKFKKNWAVRSFLMINVSKLLRSLTKNEWCEQMAQVTHQKWATVSDLLRLLSRNEQTWANCSGRSPKMSEWTYCSFFLQIAHLLIFSQKTRADLSIANYSTIVEPELSVKDNGILHFSHVAQKFQLCIGIRAEIKCLQ